MKEKCFIW